jgi:hypothetical protein
MMKRFLAVLTLLIPAVAVADARVDPKPGDYLDNGTLSVVLGGDACTVEKALEALKPEARQHYRLAEIVYEGRSLKGCWRYLPDYDAVFMIDEEGDQGPVMRGLFHSPVQG